MTEAKWQRVQRDGSGSTSLYARGAVLEAVALLPARVDTRWFARLDPFPQCHIRGRLRFNGAGTAPFLSSLVHVGANVDGFVAAYRPFGRMVRSLDL